MERQELLSTLTRLHAELSRAEKVDPETLDMLQQLTADIGRLLERNDDAVGEDAEGVASGLKALLLKFEAEHPQLSTTVGKVADALAAIGI
jgi:hypothetical protein